MGIFHFFDAENISQMRQKHHFLFLNTTPPPHQNLFFMVLNAILKYCLRHNGNNIYMPKKYLSATLWETICTHFSHRCWIFAIFRHNKSPPTPANKLSVSCQQSTLSPLKFHNSATHTSLFYTTHSRRMGRFIVLASPPLMFRGWIFISSASIYSPFVGVYIYVGTANLPIQLLTTCYSDANKQPLHC